VLVQLGLTDIEELYGVTLSKRGRPAPSRTWHWWIYQDRTAVHIIGEAEAK
jgi:hypothetical protein